MSNILFGKVKDAELCTTSRNEMGGKREGPIAHWNLNPLQQTDEKS